MVVILAMNRVTTIFMFLKHNDDIYILLTLHTLLECLYFYIVRLYLISPKNYFCYKHLVISTAPVSKIFKVS